jgi:hypothetical protein
MEDQARRQTLCGGPTASSSAASFQHPATRTSRTDPPAAMVSCSELFGRPDPPLQARELGSNHDKPSTCHRCPTSEDTGSNSFASWPISSTWRATADPSLTHVAGPGRPNRSSQHAPDLQATV